ncbi:hypothetical protein ACFS7Z_14085 [Pontibacter toksunensis]|uniref:Glycosyltransferase family 61 protein n=2 Tax=Pontibacter toksunensis TaxID=1332631 RepID=A0ABW6BW13_9BACT
MQSVVLKLLYLVASLKYPKIEKDYRYFIRDNYFCRINQTKYLFRDYIKKDKYKVISYKGEFDQELRYVIPFAYWHYLNGTLKKTISCRNTKELYFFSDNHEERFEERDWEFSYSNYEFPNMTHSNSFSFSKWKRVPYKQHFKNDVFVYEKPLLVISNKFNIEWDSAPLNFLGIEDLEKIISLYRSKYQIVYNRPLPTQIITDNSETLDLNEYSWLRENHPEVLLVNDLYEQHRSIVNNFNHLQLMVYSNCNHFISMHGGTAALASCFGGVNFILSKGNPKEVHLNEFSTIFPALSGARIIHASSTDSLFEQLEKVL